MTDRRFYLLLTLLFLALASGEIAYGVFGPLSASTHQIDEFSGCGGDPGTISPSRVRMRPKVRRGPCLDVGSDCARAKARPRPLGLERACNDERRDRTESPVAAGGSCFLRMHF